MSEQPEDTSGSQFNETMEDITGVRGATFTTGGAAVKRQAPAHRFGQIINDRPIVTPEHGGIIRGIQGIAEAIDAG